MVSSCASSRAPSIIDKEARLPRIVGGAREFLEFAERQGLTVDPAAYAAADRYGDSRSDLAGRVSASPFETPPAEYATGLRAPVGPGPGVASLLAEPRVPQLTAVEQRLAELRVEQERLAADRRAADGLAREKQQLQDRCTQLEAELTRLAAAAAEAVKQRDLWQMTATAAEDRLRLLQAELDAPAAAARGSDRRFEQLRRYLARELHPDLAGEDLRERTLREALFKRVWAKIEQLQ